MPSGIFIAFEGLDGSGKTTQMAILREKLLKRGIKCREEREPSDGIIGLIARGVIKKKITLSPHTLALLFAADRYEHVLNDVKPLIDGGTHVLTDRYLFSNFAYQGMDCTYDELYSYNKRVIDLLMPDITIFIDVTPEKCLDRITKSRIGTELFDERGEEVREIFLETFERLKEYGKIEIIDGNGDREVIADKIWEAVSNLSFTLPYAASKN